MMSSEICPRNQCTGCNACYSACTHSAIEFARDELGFTYPVINIDRCVGCGMCKTACPNHVPPIAQKPNRIFVGNCKDHQLQRKCTSGGIASFLAQYICETCQGIVYGCCGTDCSDIRHIRIANPSELWKIRGSKYVKSEIGSIFRSVKKDLLADHYVLFIGTPCQVAGLKCFLRKPHDKLFTVDFVCHGVPSQQLLNDAAQMHGFPPSSDYSVVFRTKANTRKSGYGLNLIRNSDNSVAFSKQFPDELYMAGFLNGLFYRESCYQCQYAKLDRVSEITLGDWHDKNGLHPTLNSKDLLSKILVNNNQGFQLFNRVKDGLDCDEISVAECDQPTSQLYRPMPEHKERARFRSLYLKSGFEKAAYLILKKDIRVAKRNRMINDISAFMKNTSLGMVMVKAVKQIVKI